MRLSTLTAVAVLSLAAALPASSQAADRSSKKAADLVKDAGRLYEKGKYREAAELLKKAQEIEPHPRIVYNIARALDQAGDLAGALDYYRQYVTSTEGTDPTLLKRASLSVDRLRTLLSKQEAERQKQEEERRKVEEQARMAKEKAEAEAERMRQEREASEARRQVELQREVDSYRLNRMLAFVAGGGAVLAAGGGTLFGLRAMEARSRFDSATTGPEKTLHESVARQRALFADISFGVGLAAAAAAVLLFPKSPEPTLGPGASVAPTLGGASLEVRF
jgi:tetratricopeptide (TPR) repeat protein